MIFAGQLTEVLSFYHIVETQSDSGYKHEEEVFAFRAKAQRLKNKEKYLVNADELFHTVEPTFRMRNRKEATETDIVIYNGLRYRIISLDRYPRDGEMTIKISKIND